MSISPSLLKSPTPIILHGAPTKIGILPPSAITVPRLSILEPVMNQIWVSLLELLRQTISTHHLLVLPEGVPKQCLKTELAAWRRQTTTGQA